MGFAMLNLKMNTLIFVSIIIQSIFIPAMAKTEEQVYKVVLSEKEFEIRFYPSATLATVYSEAKSYKELSGPGFRKLAGYIFGGNESDTKISMTSPVHMDINNSRSSMSFVMPSSFMKENLPKPEDPAVLIEKTKDEYVAAIRFSGYASDEDIRTYSEKLKNLLLEKGINFYGNFRYLGYDPPYKFLGRRNEIIVSVTWSEKQDK
jgi:SOUL heme-binding protein